MLILLACSAFLSSSETAFFNLSHRQKKLLEESEHKLQKLTARLLDKPSQLLGCLLLGNMVVNVLYFAISSVFAGRIGHQVGITAATAILIVIVAGALFANRVM